MLSVQRQLLCLIGLTTVYLAVSQNVFQPSRPVLNPRMHCLRKNKYGRSIHFISDQQTKCQYWRCVGFLAIPTSCGLQTYVSEFYEGDDYNPCTETYNDTSKQFDCTRKGYDPDGTPTCISTYKEFDICKNGGEVVSQGNLCWCRCASSYSGFTCTIKSSEKSVSGGRVENAEAGEEEPTTEQLRQQAEFQSNYIRLLRLREKAAEEKKQAPTEVIRPPGLSHVITGRIELSEGVEPRAVSADAVVAPPAVANGPRAAPDGRFISDDPCPTGPPIDYCARDGGCLNGGTCVNQCLGMICLCKPPYTAGRKCEKFQCQVGVECMNGGTCSRGPSEIDPVATCTCRRGFSGPMCEIVNI